MEIQTINKEGLDTVLLKDSLINEIKNTLMSNFDEKSNSDEIKDNFSTNIGSAIANGVDLWLKESLVSVEIDVNESISLSSLKDVSIVSPVKNNILVYNGIKWENKDQSSVVSTWDELLGKPTTLAGYGISSSDTLFDGKYAALSHTHPFSSIINKPTTLSGYGILDAYTKTAIDNALLAKLDKSVFDDLFEKVEVSNGVYAIKAKYNFYSVGEVSAYGLGNSGGGGTGASSLSELVDVSLTSLLPNQILRYNGTHWVNENLDIVTTWDELLGKPTTFPASPHIHAISEITGLQGSLDSKASATTLTNHIEDSDIHITSDERTNWDSAYTNTHTHPNKDTIDSLTPTHLEVLSILSLVEGKLRIDADAYSTGELSAYGEGESAGGGNSYNRLDSWLDYIVGTSEGWVLSALLGKELDDRVTTLEDAPPVDSDKHFVYIQATPANTWTVIHNLGKYPTVTVVDSANTELVGDIQYIDLNSFRVTFSSDFSGKVFCN